MKIVECCLKKLHVTFAWILFLCIIRCTCQSSPEQSSAIPYNMQPSYGNYYRAEYPFYYQSYDNYYYSKPDYQAWLNTYMNWLLMKRQYDDAARYQVNVQEYPNVMTQKPVEILPEKPEYDQLLLKTLNKYNSILKNYYGHIKHLHKFISKQENTGSEQSHRKHKQHLKNGHSEVKKERDEEMPGDFNSEDTSTLKYDGYSSITDFPPQPINTDNKENFFSKSSKMDETSKHFNKIENKKIKYDSSKCRNEFCVTQIIVTEKSFVSDRINPKADISSEVAIKIKNDLEHTTEVSDKHNSLEYEKILNKKIDDEIEKEDFKSTTTGQCEKGCTTTANRTTLENKYATQRYFDKLTTMCDKKYPFTDKPEVFNDNADQLIKTTNHNSGNAVSLFNKQNGATKVNPEIKNKNNQSDPMKTCSNADCTKSPNVLDIKNKSEGGIFNKNSGYTKCYVTCDDRHINGFTRTTPISDDGDFLEHTTMRPVTDLQSSSLSCYEKKAGHERSCDSIELYRRRLLKEEYFKYLYTTNGLVESTTENCNPEKMATTDMDTNVLECRNCKELNEIREMVKRLRLIGISFLDMGHLLLDEDYRYPIIPKFMDHITKKP